MPPVANVVDLWENQQLGRPSLDNQRDLIDYRIRTLRDSRKHLIVPWKNRPVAASALNFDDAEQRFLLCGSCVGDVTIVDTDSPIEKQPTVPLKHTTYRSQVSQRHRYLISGCQFYPVDSGMFVTASMDQEVRLWDSESMRVIDKYKNETAILDSHWGMPNSSGLIAIALGSSCVRLIDPRIRSHIQHLRWKNKFAKCLRWMSTPSHFLLAGSEAGNMVLWDIRSARQELMEITTKAPTNYNERRGKPAKAHNCCINSIRCTKNGRYVVSLANDRRIHVWDSSSMQLEQAVSLDTEGQCTSMSEMGDEGNELYGFIGVGKNLVVSRLTPSLNKSDIKQLKCSTNQRVLRSSSNKFEDCSSSSDQRVIRGHFQAVMSVAYRRTHQQVVTSSADGSTLVWAPEMDEVLPEQEKIRIEELYRDDFSDDE